MGKNKKFLTFLFFSFLLISLNLVVAELPSSSFLGDVVGLNASSDGFNVYSYNGGVNASVEGNGFNVPFPESYTEFFGGSDAVSFKNFTLERAEFDAQFNLVGNSSVRTDLVLDLPFEEGSGTVTVDVSGNGNDGEIYGASWVDGKYGSGLNFNGSPDRVEGTLNSVSNGATVSIWLNPSEWAHVMGIIEKNQVFRMVKRTAGSDSIYCDFYIDGEWRNFGNDFYNYMTGLTIGVWHHVVLTYDVATHIMSGYVDGILKRTGALTGLSSYTINDNSNALKIGHEDSFGFGLNFKGVIDAVRFFNRSLSEGEVQNLYEYGSVDAPTVAPDEMVVFFSGNIDTYKGLEFGVIAKFIDNSVLGYVQVGDGLNVTVFEVVTLMENDNLMHHYRIDLESDGDSTGFAWFVDGVQKGALVSAETSFVSSEYYAVFTTHRFTNFWDSEDSFMLAGNLGVQSVDASAVVVPQVQTLFWYQDLRVVLFVGVVMIIVLGLVKVKW